MGMVALKPWQILCYGAPGLALAMPTIPLYVFLPSFYVQQRGLDLAIVGIVLLAARLSDMVTDPLIGALSDRMPGRFGRRKPFIAIGGLIALIAMFMLFTPPDGVTWGYLLVWTVTLYLGWTLVNIPYTAWGAELADDYHLRTKIVSAREAAMVIGILIAAILPVVSHRPDAADNSGLLALAAAATCLGVPSVALLLAKLPEPANIAPRPAPMDLRRNFASLWQNGPFRRLLSAWFLNGMANGLPASLFPLFVTAVLSGSEQDRNTALLLYFAVAVFGIPVWLMLSKRFGKHRTWCAAMAVACLAFSGALLLGSGDMALFFVICAITGLMLGADLVLPPAMQADVLDVDRLETGEERAGLLFAIWSMAQKLSLALAVGIAFPLLDLAGFDAHAEEPGALWALSLFYAGIPVLFKLAAIRLMHHHMLDEAAQKSLRAQITARKSRLEGKPI